MTTEHDDSGYLDDQYDESNDSTRDEVLPEHGDATDAPAGKDPDNSNSGTFIGGPFWALSGGGKLRDDPLPVTCLDVVFKESQKLSEDGNDGIGLGVLTTMVFLGNWHDEEENELDRVPGLTIDTVAECDCYSTEICAESKSGTEKEARIYFAPLLGPYQDVEAIAVLGVWDHAEIFASMLNQEAVMGNRAEHAQNQWSLRRKDLLDL